MSKAGTAIESPHFSSLEKLRVACLDLPSGDLEAAGVAAERQGQLTKPPGSLGRLEDAVVWLAQWQGRSMPRLDRVDILVFAGNHGVTAQGVSAYPAEVTAQMVANFSAGGAAINQLARTVGANLHVIALALEQPTADFTQALAMNEDAFLTAVGTGYEAVSAEADLVCLGEMGIGNTTGSAAAALAGLVAAPGWTKRAWHENALRSTRASPAMRRCCLIRSRAQPRSAGANSPPSWARRLRRATAASRCCSTASSAWRRSPRWQNCVRTRSITPWRRMSRPRRRIGCC